MNLGNYQETKKIKTVSLDGDGYWYSIVLLDGWCCGMKASYGAVPKVGDDLTVHTKGGAFGTIRGMDLNGHKVFWKTDEELEAERVEWLRKNEEEKQQKFKDNVAEMDRQYDALPKCFQERIDKFRANNDRFRVDFEEYELFCCEQAVVIAKGCKSAAGVVAFRELAWEKQLKQAPELSGQHSGNTLGCAITLAYWYLQDPKNVVKMHGAMASLVGSKEYGDVPND